MNKIDHVLPDQEVCVIQLPDDEGVLPAGIPRMHTPHQSPFLMTAHGGSESGCSVLSMHDEDGSIAHGNYHTRQVCVCKNRKLWIDWGHPLSPVLQPLQFTGGHCLYCCVLIWGSVSSSQLDAYLYPLWLICLCSQERYSLVGTSLSNADAAAGREHWHWVGC